MSFYQYLIYDNDQANCYQEDGVIIDYSNLYKNKEECTQDATQAVCELEEDSGSDGRYQYKVVELEVVDQ